MTPAKSPSPKAAPTTQPREPGAKKPGAKKRRAPDPAKKWASYLRRYRPGLVPFVLDGLTERYGPQRWERRLDPVSELILTILTQNTADVNAEKAYEALRAAYPSERAPEEHHPGIGWGGDGLSTAPPPDWSRVENAPLPELIDVIRPGGLAPQKAPRLQATLARIRDERGAYDLEFLAELPVLEARDWLTSIDGIGKKTASIVLAFCFGAPVMAVDRHVERVSKRIGLIPEKATADQAHDLFLELVDGEHMYAAHVLLIHHGREICHAQRPAHDICPLRDRCRMVSPKAP
ncbi:MAG: endonuclease III domain-containing protein [Candidatus Limnocylindrales bacterium]